jgi:DNA-binding Lrp family transcriptional regulator
MPSGEVAFDKEAKKIVSSGLTEEDIENVRNELPPQPWPKDTHKEVANKLGMSNSAVLRSTKELIKRGIFKEQVDGVLYDLVKTDGEDLTS